ncbi:serine/threonine protein kinase [Ktedonobacteria bacterium brp13]|nr:serine/threonine protein kinase [Ktedonobacteria bacterium brp13]
MGGYLAMPVTGKTQIKTALDVVTGNTLHDGEYLLQGRLGNGGQSNIFLATHTQLSIPLALKQVRADQPLPEHVVAELDYILHGGDITRRSTFNGDTLQLPSDTISGGTYTDHFLREALLLARLYHTAIPTLYDYFAEDGDWYLVTDYIPGRSLAAYLQQYAPLPPQEALNYALQLCDLLDYLHRQRPPIIFWDLRPEQMMLTPDGTIMLTGFGLARTLKDYPDPSQAIAAGQLSATSSPYAAPEQKDEYGFSSIDTRADLYSLGLILYEMVSGALPSGKTLPELSLASLSSSNTVLLPAVSRMLSSLVKLAIQPEPVDRFQSAQTFSLALERAYRIEERRAYQQQLIDHALPEKRSTTRAQANYELHTHNDGMAGLPGIPPHTLNLEQRRLTREALHSNRHERLQQEQLENQLASFDENLTRRSNMSQSLYALEVQQSHTQRLLQSLHLLKPLRSLYAKCPGHLQALFRQPKRVRQHKMFKMRRFIQTSFFLALLLFLVLVSLLTYVRILQYNNNHTQQSQPTNNVNSSVTIQ